MSRYAFHPLARDELEQQVAFYEAHAPGLGRAFTPEVRTAIEAAVATPQAGNPYHAGTRRKILSRFPYALVYLPDSVLLIVAVAHHRRRPGYWSKRIKAGTG